MSHRIIIALAALGGAFVVAVAALTLLMVADAAPTQAFRNVSRAMEPTLLAGERFTIREIRGNPNIVIRRGELVVHAWPFDRSKRFVKRIVGVPGDTLAMIGGHLTVNGRMTAEPYAWQQDSSVDPVTDDFQWQKAYVVGPAARDTANYIASRNNWGPIVVPMQMYFVLGDNRDNSLDSRYSGFVPREDILGKVRRIYFSQDSAGRIHWSRLGRRVQ